MKKKLDCALLALVLFNLVLLAMHHFEVEPHQSMLPLIAIGAILGWAGLKRLEVIA